MPDPALSVVVAVAEGGAALRGCLEALAAQQDAPPLEVLVPCDDAVPGARELAAAFPEVRWLPLSFAGPPRDALEDHERIDRRRAAGLAAARAPLVALLVDRGWPRPDWARRIAELHAREPAAAIGGAVVCGAGDARGRALFLCDFGRFEPPLHDDAPRWVSDVNVCYRREALEALRAVWEPRYQEAALHWEMRRRGDPMRLRDGPTVVHRRGAARWPALLAERVQWGRNWARLHGGTLSRGASALRAAAAPLVPVVLLARHVAAQRRAGAVGGLGRALPALVALLVAWSAGELVGYAEAALGRRAGH